MSSEMRCMQKWDLYVWFSTRFFIIWFGFCAKVALIDSPKYAASTGFLIASVAQIWFLKMWKNKIYFEFSNLYAHFILKILVLMWTVLGISLGDVELFFQELLLLHLTGRSTFLHNLSVMIRKCSPLVLMIVYTARTINCEECILIDFIFYLEISEHSSVCGWRASLWIKSLSCNIFRDSARILQGDASYCQILPNILQDIAK